MSFLSSPADDMPDAALPAGAQVEHLVAITRARRSLNLALDDVERMIVGQARGDASFTGPGCGTSLNLALNRLDDVPKAARPVVAPEAKPLPVSKPFGRRPVPDSRLPAVASPAGAA